MRSLPGYSVEKLLHGSCASEVYLAKRDGDDRWVAIKVYLDPDPEAAVRRARGEAERLLALDAPGTPGVVELIEFSTEPALVLEYAGGVRLTELSADGPVSTETFLRVAASFVRTLERVHAHHVLHRDLCPTNLLVSRTSDETWIVDFELARPVGEREGTTDTLDGSLAYISPEQTGRMDRGVDFRSDLYSLGASLYHLVCGTPPFPSDDPLALVHAHIARAPRPVTELRPDIPPTVGRIIEKLLQKEPSDRYQTCAALAKDLEVCLEQLERTGSIADELPLGTADAPVRVLFRGRLCGRERELEDLHAAFARVAKGGAVELFVLSGPPGIGKTSLLETMRPAASGAGAVIARGKFDLYRSDVPYAGVSAALESAIDQILTEDDARLEARRARLEQSLGGLGDVAVQLFPDLSAVLGPRAAPPALGAEETLHRTALTVSRLICGLGDRGQPLVIVLDDMQWADAGSLQIVDRLIQARDTASVLVCMTYRDSEVGEDHPVRALLDDWEESGIALRRIEIGPLSDASILHMLHMALDRGEDVLLPLVAQIVARAGRSPFHIQQFVHHLHDCGVLRAKPGGGWTWSIDEVAAADIPESVVEVMALKIGRLAPTARKVLQLASCIGDTFDAPFLCEVASLDRSEVDAGLWRLNEEGLLAPCRAGYRFVHDRIREAAQTTLDERLRAELHHSAARVLMSRCSPDELQERAIELADHLNRSRALIDESERLEAARINFNAGVRAMGQGDGRTALGYFTAGRDLLVPEDWVGDASLCWQLGYESAEALRIAGEYDPALALLDELDERAPSPSHRAYVAYRRLYVYSVIDSDKAVDIALESLRSLGVVFPKNPSHWRLRFTQIRTDWIIGRGGRRTWTPPPPDVPPDKLPVMLVIRGASGAIIRVNARLMLLVVAHVATLISRYGALTPGSNAYLVGGYGHLRMLAGVSPGPSSRYCAQATETCESMCDARIWTRGAVQVYGMLQPWFRPRRAVLAPLRDTYERGIEFGDNEFAYYAHFLAGVYRGLAGVQLRLTVDYLDESCEIGARLRSGSRERALRIRDLYRALAIAEGPAVAELVDDLCRNAVEGSRAALAPHALLALCVTGAFESGVALVDLVGETIWNATGSSPWTIDYQLFAGLCAAAAAENTRGRRRRELARRLRAVRRCFARWRGIGPDYAHYALLLDAEAARLRGRTTRAFACYARAAEIADASQHLHHVGIVRSREATLLDQHRRGTHAERARAASRTAFAEWGYTPR